MKVRDAREKDRTCESEQVYLEARPNRGSRRGAWGTYAALCAAVHSHPHLSRINGESERQTQRSLTRQTGLVVDPLFVGYVVHAVCHRSIPDATLHPHQPMNTIPSLRRNADCHDRLPAYNKLQSFSSRTTTMPRELADYAPLRLGSGGTGGASAPESLDASSSSANMAAARFIASASFL